MKAIRCWIAFICFSAMLAVKTDASAQCAMCTLNAENSVKNGNTEGKGLNKGILYLLAAPYLAVAGVGFLWYKRYRRKDVSLKMKDQKINMN